MEKIHLIANAHIDPVWLWTTEDAIAATLATFRSAATLLEKNDFIFCHNEALLYEWIEEYDPELFARIAKLVVQGKWHIMGGWYLQPDCNMPTGESLVRQAMTGLHYFLDKFGVRPKTAVNLDPFGHSVGLVQILKKTGFDNYLITRPHLFDRQDVPDGLFLWEGLDGSQINTLLLDSGYNSVMGKVDVRIESCVRGEKEHPYRMIMWGVGNHGGGPSQKDLDYIASNKTVGGFELIHSTPDAYFEEHSGKKLFKKGLNNTMPGCYTSMIRIKQLNRRLENSLYTAEKIASLAALSGLIEYPSAALGEAERDLMFCQFHDILPGTCILEGEDGAIERYGHGLTETAKARRRAFCALADRLEPAVAEEYPVVVFNPHPYELKAVQEVEFVLENQNRDNDFTVAEFTDGKDELPAQLIKERSSLNLDWVKRYAFECTLAPFSLKRFSAKVKKIPARPEFKPAKVLRFSNNCGMTAEFDGDSGLLKRLSIEGKDYLKDAFEPVVYADNPDPWAMLAFQQQQLVSEEIGSFKLMDAAASAAYAASGVKEISSLRHVEEGDVYSLVEGDFSYNGSKCRMTYKIYKNHNYIDVGMKVVFCEADKMLKLRIPTLVSGEYAGQIVFGRETLPQNGKEVVSQKWVAMLDGDKALAVINDGIHGSSNRSGVIELSLLRGAVYSAHPIDDLPIIPPGRASLRIDQGEREFSLRVGLFDSAELDKEAQVFNERPVGMQYFPAGFKNKGADFSFSISNPKLTLSCFKKSVTENVGYIIRLYNGTADKESTVIKLHGHGITEKVTFAPFEVKTFRLKNGTLSEEKTMEI